MRRSSAARAGGTVRCPKTCRPNASAVATSAVATAAPKAGPGKSVAAEPQARDGAHAADDGHLDGGEPDRVVAVGRLPEDHDVGGEGDGAPEREELASPEAAGVAGAAWIGEQHEADDGHDDPEERDRMRTAPQEDEGEQRARRPRAGT